MIPRLHFTAAIAEDLPPPRLTLEQYMNFLNFTRRLALEGQRAPPASHGRIDPSLPASNLRPGVGERLRRHDIAPKAAPVREAARESMDRPRARGAAGER